MRWRWLPVEVVTLYNCFIRRSGLDVLPSSPSLPIFSSVLMSRVFFAPLFFPFISRYRKKFLQTLLPLHNFPSVHRRIIASCSSHTKTEPEVMSCRSSVDNRRWIRGNRPSRHASKSLIASADVWI